VSNALANGTAGPSGLKGFPRKAHRVDKKSSCRKDTRNKSAPVTSACRKTSRPIQIEPEWKATPNFNPCSPSVIVEIPGGKTRHKAASRSRSSLSKPKSRPWSTTCSAGPKDQIALVLLQMGIKLQMSIFQFTWPLRTPLRTTPPP